MPILDPARAQDFCLHGPVLTEIKKNINFMNNYTFLRNEFKSNSDNTGKDGMTDV